MSEVFKRCIFRQLYMIWAPSSKYQCGFGKGYCTQHCFLSRFGRWKHALDKKMLFRLLLTDLSKAFDCLSPQLVLAKLHAHGFHFVALRLMHSYLTNRKQRTKIKSGYSSLEKVLFRGSSRINTRTFILCDMLFVMGDIDFANYADGNTPSVPAGNIEDVIRKLEVIQ